MAEFLCIDQIESGVAICEREDRTRLQLPVSALPKAAREGDVLCLENGVYRIDTAETDRRRQAAIDLFQSLLMEEGPEETPATQAEEAFGEPDS